MLIASPDKNPLPETPIVVPGPPDAGLSVKLKGTLKFVEAVFVPSVAKTWCGPPVTFGMVTARPGKFPEPSDDSLPTCVPPAPPKRRCTVLLAVNPPPLTVVELAIAPAVGETEMLAAAKLVAAG